MGRARRIAQRVGAFFVALGAGIKIALGFAGLILVGVFAYGRRKRAQGQAEGRLDADTAALDYAAKSGDEAVQEYIERKYEEDK